MVNDIPIMFARPGDFVTHIPNIACLISSTRVSKGKHLSRFGINLTSNILSFYPKSLHLGCLSKSKRFFFYKYFCDDVEPHQGPFGCFSSTDISR